MWRMIWKGKEYIGTYNELTNIVKGYLGPVFEKLQIQLNFYLDRQPDLSSKQGTVNGAERLGFNPLLGH